MWNVKNAYLVKCYGQKDSFVYSYHFKKTSWTYWLLLATECSQQAVGRGRDDNLVELTLNPSLRGKREDGSQGHWGSRTSKALTEGQLCDIAPKCSQPWEFENSKQHPKCQICSQDWLIKNDIECFFLFLSALYCYDYLPVCLNSERNKVCAYYEKVLAPTAITTYHNLGALNNRKLFSQGSGG